MKDVLKVDDWIGSQNAQFEFCTDSLNFARRLNDGVVFGIGTILYREKNIDNGDEHFVYHVINKFHDNKTHVTIQCIYLCNGKHISDYVIITEMNDIKYGS